MGYGIPTKKSPLQVYASGKQEPVSKWGGANVGDLNLYWVELKAIMKGFGVTTWPEFEHFVEKEEWPDLAKTDIDSQWRQLLQWLIKALSWSAIDYGIESRQTSLWSIYYHRDLLNIPAIVEGIKNPPKVDEDVQLERFVQSKYVEVTEAMARQAGPGHIHTEDKER